MGVNANFTADFSTFLSAIDAADVALADFGKGAETVETKLNNMVDKFSGRALIQQANELVVAINAVGGATALTTSEQTRLNATLDQAIQKYHAIGEEVPPAMQALADQTKQVDSGVGGLVDSLGSLAGAFGIAFSIEAVVGFGEHLLESAVNLRNLSLQTRINIDDLQVLTAAFGEFGVQGDQLARALFQLQQRIAGGDTSVEDAYRKMGLSMDQVKAKSPDVISLLLTTEKGLGGVSGAAQDLAAKELFGGRLGASMIAFANQANINLDAMRNLVKAAGPDETKKLAEYSNAVDRFKLSFEAVGIANLGQIIEGVQKLSGAVETGAGTFTAWVKAVTSDWWSGTDAGMKKFEADRLAATQNQAKADADAAAASKNKKAAVSEEAQARAALEADDLNRKAALTEWQKKDLDILKQRGELDAKHASDIFVTATQLEVYKKGLEAAKKASEELSKQEAAADAIAMAAYEKRAKAIQALTEATIKAYSFEGQIQNLKNLEAEEEALARAVYDQTTSEKDRMKIIEDLAARKQAIEKQIMDLEVKHAQLVDQQIQAELAARAQVLAAQGLNVNGTEGQITATQKYNAALDALHDKKQAGIDQTNQEEVLHIQWMADMDAENGIVRTNSGVIDLNTGSLNANTSGMSANTGATTANTAARQANAAASTAAAAAATAAAAAAAAAPPAGPTGTTGGAGTSGGATVPPSPSTGKSSGGSSTGFSPGGSIPSSWMLAGSDVLAMSATAAGMGGQLAWDSYGNPYVYIPGLNAMPTVGAGPGISYVLNGPGISVSGGPIPRALAEGGPVTSGTPYFVGEQGPELFVPSSSGSVVANGAGVTVNNTFHIVDTESNIARRVSDTIMRSVMRGARL